MFMTENSYL